MNSNCNLFFPNSSSTLVELVHDNDEYYLTDCCDPANCCDLSDCCGLTTCNTNNFSSSRCPFGYRSFDCTASNCNKSECCTTDCCTNSLPTPCNLLNTGLESIYCYPQSSSSSCPCPYIRSRSNSCPYTNTNCCSCPYIKSNSCPYTNSYPNHMTADSKLKSSTNMPYLSTKLGSTTDLNTGSGLITQSNKDFGNKFCDTEKRDSMVKIYSNILIYMPTVITILCRYYGLEVDIGNLSLEIAKDITLYKPHLEEIYKKYGDGPEISPETKIILLLVKTYTTYHVQSLLRTKVK